MKALQERADSFCKVEGTVRCHKCSLLFKDAERYLTHICGQPLKPAEAVCSSQGTPPSRRASK